MQKRVTSYDVAKKAGVSQATVSYVLNGSSRQTISPKTRERVLAAARELNYFPNNAARSLRQESTGYICVVTNKTLGHPRYAETVQALRSELEKNGYSILLANEKEEPEADHPSYLRDFFSRKVDGIVYIGADGKPVSDDVLELVRKHSIPFLAYDCKLAAPDISSVDLNYEHGIRSAAEELLNSGCKKLLYICPEGNTPQEYSRKQAFNEFCEERSVPNDLYQLDMRSIIENELERGYGSLLPSLEEAKQPLWYRGLKETLRHLPPDTGIICAWRVMMDFTVSLLLEGGQQNPLAVLTDERVWYPYPAPVFVSALPNRQAGVLCAEGIIEAIKEPQTAFKRSVHTQPAKKLW